MVIFPNAKINLGLNVTERRPDGYHNLESIFYPVGLCDVLEIIEAQDFLFRATGLEVDASDEQNLVVRAYHLLRQDFDLPPVRIRLHKVIPMGAGLGGGSSDAAFTLKVLNDMFGLGLNQEQQVRYAVKLGADCPFFIYNQPAYAAGIGDLLSPGDIDLKNYDIILIKPPVAVNTAMAYRSVTPHRHEVPVKDAIRLPVEMWKDFLFNDFEKPVFSMFPAIGAVKHKLYESGALYAGMSGSGSAVYGIFREIPKKLHSGFPSDYFMFTQTRLR